MLSPQSMARLDLGTSPGILPALGAGLEAWGTPGFLRHSENTGISLPIEIVTEGDWKWAEVAFISPELLFGNASIGWHAAPARCRAWLERSDTLAVGSFSTTGFGDAPGFPTPVLGGYAYAARSIYPVDAKLKTATLVGGFASGGDTRNNPFTAITIADTVLILPNFPYTMPTAAAQLQADLRAAGWTGATVSAASATAWSVAIPNVPLSDWSMTNYISWPQYAFTDALGNASVSNGQAFVGSYVDSNTVPVKPRQFFRMGLAKF